MHALRMSVKSGRDVDVRGCVIMVSQQLRLCVCALLILYNLRVSARKSVVDFDDSDMEKLFQQWEVSKLSGENTGLLSIVYAVGK